LSINSVKGEGRVVLPSGLMEFERLVVPGWYSAPYEQEGGGIWRSAKFTVPGDAGGVQMVREGK